MQNIFGGGEVFMLLMAAFSGVRIFKNLIVFGLELEIVLLPL